MDEHTTANSPNRGATLFPSINCMYADTGLCLAGGYGIRKAAVGNECLSRI